MGDDGLPSLGRVKLVDLVVKEGLPSDSYKLSVSTLCHSLSQYSAAILQFPDSDAALLRSALDSAPLYFHHRPSHDFIHTNDTHHQQQDDDWCRSSGYHSVPQLSQETYVYRPGLTPTDPPTGFPLSPAALVDIFPLLGKASRDILDAISFNWSLRSSPFTEILDNVPLRPTEISSSVLSLCCQARPTFHNLTPQEDGNLIMFPDQQNPSDKSLISIVKSDQAGLHIRDYQGHWVLVDGDLGPHEAVIYPGLALYQATAGYINPALHRIEITNPQSNLYGRCSLTFKLMPKSMTSLNSSEMRAAGHGVDAQFQLPVPVDDFMQRSHPSTSLLSRQPLPTFNFPTAQDGSMKPSFRKRKNNSKCKSLPPSKRLRLEAQRVLKERVQDIADEKGIKLRFCSLKECENHVHLLDSPCANIRMEIGWPPGVPFVHPHDLPNKAKIGFLEAYEPGWTITHDMELSLIDAGQSAQHSGH